jgi:transposase
MPRPGPRTTYKYSEHFKATAVRLSQLPGVGVLPHFHGRLS